MILNIPPDRRGHIFEKDSVSLVGFGNLLSDMYAKNLASGAKLPASNIRGNDSHYAPKYVLDKDRYSYWATDDSVTTPNLILKLKGNQSFDVLRLRENIKLGQRIDDWEIDIMDNGNWKEYAKASVCPCLSEVGIYKGDFLQ
jgi:alpha-L-fucosidase